MSNALVEIRKRNEYCERLSTDAARAIFESAFGATAFQRLAELDRRYGRKFSAHAGKYRIRIEGNPDRVTAWAVAQRVREARERMGLRQEDLAAKAGIARPNIARLEKGIHLPTLSTLQKIAAALSIEMNSLMMPPATTHSDRHRFKEMAEAGLDEWEKNLEAEDTGK